MYRVVIFAALAAGCGRASLASTPGGPAGAGGTHAGGAGGTHAGGAGGTHAGGAGGTDAGGGGTDAGGAGTDASCDALQMMAQATFDTFVAAHGGCATDTDCTVIPTPGRCLNGCIYVLNGAAVPGATDAAAGLCVEFNAQGCSRPPLLCPPPPTSACQGGTCLSVH